MMSLLSDTKPRGIRSLRIVRPAAPNHDLLVTVQEVAKRLGVSSKWVYRRADKLPFRVELEAGSPLLRFSARGLEDWIRRRNRLTRNQALR